jgi:peptidyl-tRNA hydrolase
MPGPDYVLEAFSSHELQRLSVITESVVQCVEVILTQGVAAAMNRFHTADPEAAAHSF